MSTSSSTTAALAGPVRLPSYARSVDFISTAGTIVLRYGLVVLLLLWGSAKFGAFEAQAIQPLVQNSPLMSWLYPIFGLRGTSSLLGVFEVTAALLIAARPWFPKISGYASLAAAGMFVVTLSFLVTTPGVLAPTNPMGGFLMKDVILLGAALFTSGEALRATRGSVA